VFRRNGRVAVLVDMLAIAPAASAQVEPYGYNDYGGFRNILQMCSDSIQFRPIGAISQPLVEWINRLTFQQADEIQGHGPG